MKKTEPLFDEMAKDIVIPEIVQLRARDAFEQIRSAGVCQGSTAARQEKKEQVSGIPRSRSPKRRKWPAILIAAALMTGAVCAAATYHLAERFGTEMESPEARDLIQTNIEVAVSGQTHIPSAYKEEGTEELFWGRPVIDDSGALLSIQEVQFDGFTLYIYGEATENGRKYELGADRVYVNDTEVSGAGLGTSDDGRTYVLSVDLSGQKLGHTFEVTLPLSIYQGDTRYQNQELTFQVNADAALQKAAPQEFAHEDYVIQISDLVTSTNQMRFRITYLVTDEQRLRNEKEGVSFFPVIAVNGENRSGSLQELKTSGQEAFRADLTVPGSFSSGDQVTLRTICPDEEGYISNGVILSEDLVTVG